MVVAIADVAGKEFDYIIVGGGTCGLVLATRLSEDKCIRVLVLEAGNACLNDTKILIPAMRRKVINDPNYDWSFSTIPQEYSNNRIYQWPRGKCLGGSSAINFQLWNIPAREYLDALSELGNSGWNWNSFEEYLKKAERFIPPGHDLDILTYDMAHRGENGPLAISFPSVISGLERPALEAFKRHGVPVLIDSSSGLTNGFAPIAATLDPTTHTRSYSANMYYQPVASRNNLTVLVNAQVSRIRVSTNGDGTITATGVHFMHDGELFEASARKEVLLCAGAIMSPQILELSGIGDPEVLLKAGIDVQLSLPGVGTNVQEHLYTGVTYQVIGSEYSGHQLQTTDSLLCPEEAAQQLSLHSSGQGAFNMLHTGVVFLPLHTVCPNAAVIQDSVEDTIRTGFENDVYSSGLRKQYELQLKHLRDKAPSLEIVVTPGGVTRPTILDPTKRHMSLVLALNNPFSRGSIHIRSNDFRMQPVIDPRIFEQPYDLITMVELVKFARRIAHTEPLAGLLSGTEVYPGPQVETDEQIAEWLKDTISTTYHTVGSCSMLPLEDDGVVDAKLKVYGTTNIRVVDIGIIPLHVGGHTQAVAYSLAEQAADIIKADM